MFNKVLAALAVPLLLTAFVTACGGDDDDTDVASDDAEEMVDDDSSAQGAFCADFNASEGGDEPIEDVQASLDLAIAMQEEAQTEEGAAAVGVLVDYAEYVIDNDDGDGVITEAEVQAALPEFPTIEDAIALVTERCAPASRTDRDGYL